MIIRKLNKYIKNKNKKIYKKLEVNISKNVTSNKILKNTKSYKKTYLSNKFFS